MKVLCFMLSNYFPVDYISVDVSDRILALLFFVYDLSYRISLRSMAVLSEARLSYKAAKTRANDRRSSSQSPRGFSALARLYCFARPNKTKMLRRLLQHNTFNY